jgi:tetratricopeptide (TPR) repeat protein
MLYRASGFILVFLLSFSVFAQEQDKKKAGELYQAGIVYFKDKLYDRAIEKFEAAYALDKNPTLLYNLCRGHQEAEYIAKAVACYELYLQGKPSDESVVRALKDALVKQMLPGKLFIDIQAQDGLVIIINGKDIVNKSLRESGWKVRSDIELKAGEYTLQAIYFGSIKANETIEIISGKRIQWQPVLLLNNQKVNIKPVIGEPQDIFSRRTIGWSTIALGGIVGVFGTWKHFEAVSYAEEARDRRDNYRVDWLDSVDHVERNRDMAYMSWAISGVIIASGSILLFFFDEEISENKGMVYGGNTSFGIVGSF